MMTWRSADSASGVKNSDIWHPFCLGRRLFAAMARTVERREVRSRQPIIVEWIS